MNLAALDAIAKAVLYEGYMLYPYRHSSVKNQQRWNFGVLYPESYSDAQTGTDAWFMQTECLAQGAQAELEVRIRFLHLMERSERNPENPRSWQEAVEREVCLPVCALAEIATKSRTHEFSFPAGENIEAGRSTSDNVTVVCRWEEVRGTIEVSATPAGQDLMRVRVVVRNLAGLGMTSFTRRDEALMKSLASTHTLLGIENGAFVSLLDPPDELREAVAGCKNIGVWPVLVGEQGRRDTMIASPIILYDYPQIAPESAGDLFDGTEIDEILSLRIMTLTDAEKDEIRRSGDRAALILERTDHVPPEQFMKMHGAMRSLHPHKEQSE